MACYSKLAAMRTPGFTKNGLRPVKVIGKAINQSSPPQLLLPCGTCIGCRLEKSAQWAARFMHEKKAWPCATFLTLTYDEKNVPENRSLKKDHLKVFFRDLHSKLHYYGLGKYRRFGVGEYGEKTQRPHYHAVIFGGSLDRSTKNYKRDEAEPSRSGSPQWTHELITSVWPSGIHRLSEVSYESAAYVARYALKKITGPLAQTHYGLREPEFQLPSKGIGKSWFDAFQTDAYPADQIVLTSPSGKAREMMPPRYYDRLLEKSNPWLYAETKADRAEREKLTGDEYFKLIYENHLQKRVMELTAKEYLKREIE